MNNCKNYYHRRIFPRVFCFIIAILTAISGTVAKDWHGLIYFIGYTIMLFFISEANQKISDNYYQCEIKKLSDRIECLETIVSSYNSEDA